MIRTPKQTWDFAGQQQQGGQSINSNQSSGGNYKTAKCKFFEKGNKMVSLKLNKNRIL